MMNVEKLGKEVIWKANDQNKQTIDHEEMTDTYSIEYTDKEEIEEFSDEDMSNSEEDEDWEIEMEEM